ncbi:S-layer family protein, partial [Salmonella enterica]|nr:S-layer family protein [Salmonella enterica]EAS9893715.1 S-layer family protein [Salmonella enterica]EHZ8150626.1 S-layer family protein [Salmonella enterica]EHZ8203840.1 S-layer family protein [Salmonella enterica]
DNGSINITGTSVSHTGVELQGNASLITSQNLALNGNSQSGTGLLVNGTGNTLNASQANIRGVSKTGTTGFNLTNLTLAGGIEHGANLSLSSAGSGDVTNIIGNNIFNVTTLTSLLNTGVDNDTLINVTGMSDLGGGSSVADWSENFAAKHGIFILDGASVNKTGNITLANVGFINSSLVAAQNLSISNGAGRLTLTNSSLNATAGTVNLTSGGGVNLTGGNVTATDIILSADTGGIDLNGTTLNATGSGNITLTGKNKSSLVNSTLKGGSITVNVSDGTDSALLINNTSLNATTNLTVIGETQAAGDKYGIQALNNSSFSAGQKLTLKADAAGGKNGALSISDITLNATDAVISGISSGIAGVGIRINGTLNNTRDNGNLTLHGCATGAEGTGMDVANASVTVNGTGKMTITGKSAQADALKFNNVTLSGGNLSLNGTGVTSGLTFNGSTINATQNITLSGNSTAGSGLSLNVSTSTLNSTGGNISLTGDGNISYTGGNLTAGNGNIALMSEEGDVTLTTNVTGASTTDHNLKVNAGGNITLGGNVTSGTGHKLNVTLQGAGSRDGAVLINGTHISAGGGDVTVRRKGTDHDMKIKLNPGTSLNATRINLEAYVGKSDTAAHYADSAVLLVRGVLNATDSINLTATGQNDNGVNIISANLNATGNITVNGTTKDLSGVKLRSHTTLTAGNISILGTSEKTKGVTIYETTTLNTTGSINVVGSSTEGTGTAAEINSKLNAGQNITLSGSSVSGTGLNADNLSLNSTGKMLVIGQSESGAGLTVNRSNLKAANATFTGISKTGRTGFNLTHLRLDEGTNLTLSSEGSGVDANNIIGNNILNVTALSSILQTGIENNTLINVTDMSDLGGGSSVADWSEKNTAKNGIFILEGASVSKTGNISLQGVDFVNSTVTAAKNLTLNNGEKDLTLTGTTLNSTGGNIALTGRGGIHLSGGEVNATDGNITLTGQKISSLVNTSLNGANITVNVSDGTDSALVINNTSLNAITDLMVTGETQAAGDKHGIQALNNSSFSAGQKLTLKADAAGGTNGALSISGITLNASDAEMTGSSKADNGVGIHINGKLTNTRENGQLTLTGNGTKAGLVLHDATMDAPGGTITALGSGSHAGVMISGNVTGSAAEKVSVSGMSFGGTGVAVSGDDVHINQVSVTGNTTSGNGITFAGTSATVGAVFNGESVSGDAVVFHGSVNTSGTTIKGNSEEGNGILLNGNVAGRGGASVISGASTSRDGIVVTGNIHLSDISVNGTAKNSNAVSINGTLTNTNVSIFGNATGSGKGVYLNGTIAGGNIIGESTTGPGVGVSSSTHVSSNTRIRAMTRSLFGKAMVLEGDVKLPEGTATIVLTDEQTIQQALNDFLKSQEFTDYVKTLLGNKGDTGTQVPPGATDGGQPIAPTEPGGSGGDITPPFPASLSRAVYEQQSRVTRSDQLKSPVQSSGYREPSLPVKVEICSDGECRSLDVGEGDIPNSP